MEGACRKFRTRLQRPLPPPSPASGGGSGAARVTTGRVQRKRNGQNDAGRRRGQNQGRLASVRRGVRCRNSSGAARDLARDRARRADVPDRPERLRQVHAAQHDRRAVVAHFRRGGGRQPPSPRADAARYRLCVPGERAVSLEHGDRERQSRHGVPGRAEGRARAPGPALARSGRAQGLRAPLSRAALRRHAPACRARARAQPGDRHPADGRAVRRARRADPHDPRRGPLGAAVAHRQDHRVRHPQPGRGDVSRRPGGGVLRAARHYQADHRRGRAASAPARFRHLAESSPPSATSSIGCSTTRSARPWPRPA